MKTTLQIQTGSNDAAFFNEALQELEEIILEVCI